MARAVHVATDITETFVIVVWALGQAVANVAGMKALRVTTATIQPRAFIGGTPRLVLVLRTVFLPVADEVHG